MEIVISEFQNSKFWHFWNFPISYEFCHLSIFWFECQKRGKQKNADTHCDRMTAATDNRVNKINCSWCALKNCFEFFFWSFSRSQNFLAWHIRQWKLYRGWRWWHPSNFDLLSWKCLKITSKMSRKNVIAVFCETGSWIFTRYIFWHRINFENRAAKMSFLLKIGAFARK